MAQATTYPEESTAETITKWYLAKDSQPKISQAEPACAVPVSLGYLQPNLLLLL